MNIGTSEIIIPRIDLRRCTGCGLCQQLCPTQAVVVQNGPAVVVRPEACNFCDVCESYCPSGAIGRPFAISFTRQHAQTAHSRSLEIDW